MINELCGTINRLELILRGGQIKRYHTENVQFQQDNAQHTWRTLVILRYLWPDTDLSTTLAALYHDVGEAVTGDVPAPVKCDPAIGAIIRRAEYEFLCQLEVPRMENLDPRQRLRIKCAEYIELCLTCMGDSGRDARRIFDNGIRYLEELMAEMNSDDSLIVATFIAERLSRQ